MSLRIFIESWHILGSTRVMHKHIETPFIALYVIEQDVFWRCMQLPKEVMWPYCRPQRQEKHRHGTGGVWGWVIYIWRSGFQKESHCSVWLTPQLLMGPAIPPALYLISSHSNPSHLVWLFVLTQAQQIISFATKITLDWAVWPSNKILSPVKMLYSDTLCLFLVLSFGKRTLCRSAGAPGFSSTIILPPIPFASLLFFFFSRKLLTLWAKI